MITPKALHRLASALLVLGGFGGAAEARQLDYRDWHEGASWMTRRSDERVEAKLYVLGESSTPGIQQVAMLISDTAEVEDGGTRNAVLFECGMHSREWFASESCYWLIDDLLRHRARADMRELRAHTDIWIVPQTNPAGRDVDDLFWGNPTRFAYVCDVGTHAGRSCSDDADCPGGVCWKEGWRANADTSTCDVGVDLARNFSSGWLLAPSLCTQQLCKDGSGYNTTTCTTTADCSGSAVCKNVRMQYRGPTPFSEPEALNLRRFVNNHMISMAAVVHTNSHEMWHLWRDIHTASRTMVDDLLAINTAGSAAYIPPDPTMEIEGVGGRYGQFSGWLSGASDVPGEPDQGTERNVSTFYFELPIKDTRYGTPFQESATDTSNSFHPSSDTMKDLWSDAIRDMFLYVIRQARSPACPVDAAGARRTSICPNDDFGLVGAKLANASDEAGLLDYDASSREETLPGGARQVVFAVQNFSASATATTTSATVSFRKNGAADGADAVVPVSLAPGDRTTFSVGHSFSTGAHYEVRIQLGPDDFARNDTKVFRFRATNPFPPARAVFGRATLNTRQREPGADDSLRYIGEFRIGPPLHPDTAGVDVLIRGRGAHAPQSPIPQSVALHVPGGAPGWAASDPQKGRWLYLDRDGSQGPVRRLRFTQRPVGQGAGERRTRVSLQVARADLAALVGSRSYTIDVTFPGDDLHLSSSARGPRPTLPTTVAPPDDGTEDEPHQPIQ